jgi:hypothetical protein
LLAPSYKEFGNLGLNINPGGHPYGWLNKKKFSSYEAQRLANQALEYVAKLRTTIFNF